MPYTYKTPPARRPNPITDDHSQPIASPPRPPRNNGGIWVVLVCIILVAAFLLPVLGMLLESEVLLQGGKTVMQYIIPICIALVVIILIARNVAIVPQANAWVIERLGKYKHT